MTMFNLATSHVGLSFVDSHDLVAIIMPLVEEANSFNTVGIFNADVQSLLV